VNIYGRPGAAKSAVLLFIGLMLAWFIFAAICLAERPGGYGGVECLLPGLAGRCGCRR
jgi:hypothetical protein